VFENVYFSYPQGEPVLSDINLSIGGGTTVALVGPSGAGKTTLTNLLARFYNPTSGCIRVNGVDIRDYDTDAFRRIIGIVEQDVFLFDGTVADNITMGSSGACGKVEEAARRANAHDFIMSLPERYNTILCRVVRDSASALPALFSLMRRFSSWMRPLAISIVTVRARYNMLCMIWCNAGRLSWWPID
jgi:ABC-type multidrug transport system fused ATPase/permease subunit